MSQKRSRGQPRKPRPPGLLGDLGARIEELRKARGMTAEELAEKAGIGVATIIRIEAGKVDPKLTTLVAIAEASGTETLSRGFKI